MTSLQKLLPVSELTIKRSEITSRNYEYIKSDFSELSDAIEIEVTFASPFPTMSAHNPILYVGDIPVAESVLRSSHTVSFFIVSPGEIEPGALIYLGNIGDPNDLLSTGYRFKVPD